MSFLHCKSCGHFELLNSSKYKLIGIGTAAFGVFGWFSYFFAGSGHAFLIALAIVIGGISCFIFANDLAKNAILKERCPRCNKINWDETPYKHPTESDNENI